MSTSRRLRRWLIGIAAFLILFTVAGFFVLPPILKTQAEKRLSAELGRAVSIGRVRLNPYALSLTIENFVIREKDGAAPFVGWNRLYVNFDALSSLAGDWVLSDIALEGFHAAVAINADSTFNFSDLLAKFTPPAGATSTPAKNPPPATKSSRAVRIVQLAVAQAKIDFSDRSKKQPFQSVVGPLTFNLTEFRTAGARGAPYQFQAVTETGEKLAWRGTLAADPLESKGEFEVGGLVLKKYTPYFEDRVRADLTDGKLSVRGRYQASFAPGQRVLRLEDGHVQLRDLRLVERGTAQAAISLADLEVSGIQADAVALKATIGRVALSGGRIAARREKDGAINLLTMLQPPVPAPTAPAGSSTATTPPTTGTAAAAPFPEATVGEIIVKDFAVEVTDNAAPSPARLGLSGLTVSLQNFSLADGAVMPLDVAFTWAPQGAVHVAGTVALKPTIKAELKTEVTALELPPLSPYLEQFMNARLTGGAISTTNTVTLTLAESGPAVNFAGDVKLDKFGLVDSAHNEELAGVSSLTLTGIKAATTPQLALSLAEVALTGPYARVFVNADQSLNLASIAKTAPPPAPGATTPAAAPASAPATAASAPAASPPQITVGRVVLNGGDFSFVDRSIEPHVRTALTQFGGTIAGISSENLARADVDLKGSVDGAGPVAITGRLDALSANPFVDLKLDFKNVDLLPLSPYTGKYAGYALARGKLVVDTKVLLEGKKLNATNVVTLHQFTFGTATESKDATKLPVRLGVALLKDIDGKIVIDLPVQGSLDDPSFSVGKVVLRVVVNLLTKAAVSPFSLLGSMFGGGGDELAFQEFAPGATDLKPAEIPKLQTMIKALGARPGLSVGLEGGYDAAADSYELKRTKLADLVRRRIWEERHALDPNIAAPAQLVITPSEQAAMIKKLFDEKFPPGTQFGGPLPPPPPVTLPPPAPAGFFKRILNTVTGADRRARVAIEQENARRAAEHEKAAAAVTAAGLPLDQMTGRLAEATEITVNDLRGLAAARAQRVRDYLTATGNIAADRLFLGQSAEGAPPDKGPRVFLSLQ